MVVLHPLDPSSRRQCIVCVNLHIPSINYNLACCRAFVLGFIRSKLSEFTIIYDGLKSEIFMINRISTGLLSVYLPIALGLGEHAWLLVKRVFSASSLISYNLYVSKASILKWMISYPQQPIVTTSFIHLC